MRGVVFAFLLTIAVVSANPTNGTNPDVEKFVAKYSEAVYGSMIGLGLIICFFGQRLFKFALFLVGGFFGGLVGFGFVNHFLEGNAYQNDASIAVSAIVGVVVGLLCAYLYVYGAVILGAFGGGVLALYLHTLFLHKLDVADPKVTLYVTVALLALICGYLAYKIVKPTICIATAVIGAYSTCFGIGFFAGGFPNPLELQKYVEHHKGGADSIVLPTTYWYYAGGILALSLLGMMVQFRHLRSASRKQDSSVEAPLLGESSHTNMYGGPITGKPIRYADRQYNV